MTFNSSQIPDYFRMQFKYLYKLYMQQFGGKDSKRHFTVVMGDKEHGLYVSSTPSSAARKAVTKLCTANKSKKVEFHIREITQGSKKKTYGPYSGYIEKLKEPIELKGRVIQYKPVVKLSNKSGAKKGGNGSDAIEYVFNNLNKLNNAPRFSGELNLSGDPLELTKRQARRKEGYRKLHGPFTNDESAKKDAEVASYLAKIEANSAKRLAEREEAEQNEKARLLKELSESLKQSGAIKKFKYFRHDPFNLKFPPFYLLVDSESEQPRYDLQYFLTSINNKYVAFHIKNIITLKDKGDIFAGPTDNLEEFKQNVITYFEKPNNNISSKKIYLQEVDGKIYPTNRTENISGYHKKP